MYTAKIRYRQASQAVELKEILQGSARLRFAEPQRAVTPGQSLVLYSVETMLGGGVIENT